jgi:hypothetical protein
MTPEERAKKIEEARAKHGKPFVLDEKVVKRITPQGPVLREILRKQQEQKKAIGNIRRIK